MPEATKQLTVEEAKTRRNQLVDELIRTVPLTKPPIKQGKPKPQTAPSDPLTLDNSPLSVEDAPGIDDDAVRTINGVHLDFYDYFGVKPDRIENSVLEKLRYLYYWTKSFDNGMNELHGIDMKLGSSDYGETKILKLYNHLRIRNGNTSINKN